MIKTSSSISYTYNDINKIVDVLYSLLPYCCVVTFEGDLGAGKTTLIKALLKKCGIEEVITSPTFSYVSCYINKNNMQTFYHFDLYRIHSLEDFVSYGFNEYLYQKKSWSFIEWPSVIHPLITKKRCSVKLEYLNESTRHFKYTLSHDVSESLKE